MEGSGYASPEIFKPQAVSTGIEETKLPEQTIEQTADQKTEDPVKLVTETETEQKPEAAVPIEVKKVEAKPEVPTNPLESLKLEDIAAFYKSKREDVLKAFGLDEFSIEAVRYYEATGGLADYAAVKSVDYSKMSDIDIVRKALRQEFAHLNLEDEDLELLYEGRITNRFKLDESQFSEREIKAGKLEMKLEADKLRKQYIEHQKKFVAPERKVEGNEADTSEEHQTAIALQVALSDSAVQSFVSGKKLLLGSGDQTYNYEVGNPQEFIDILFQPDKYAIAAAKRDKDGRPVKDQQGNYIPDYNRLLKAVAVLNNPEEYDRLLIDHGKSLGKKDIVDEIENPTNKQTHSANGEPTTVWGAMKQNMRWV